MKRVLLHICCGVCASSVVERLREQGFNPSGLFYNPNIYPKEEYLKRKEQAKRVASILKFELHIGPYNKDDWFTKIRGLEKEPEGGKRCNLCFEIRLRETNKKAKKLGLDYFTTTLSVSPHKNTAIINEIGKMINPTRFLIYDFKKQKGFALAIEFVRRYNLYRQNYCGCIYSKKC